MQKKVFKAILIMVVAIVMVWVYQWVKDSKTAEVVTEVTNETHLAVEVNNPRVTMMMQNGQEILIDLYPQIAPNTVNNFIELIETGFYDGLIFHRVISGFMLQGGDPEGTGTGGPGYGIKGEFSENGFENKLLHTRGVLSMARSNDPNSAGSQFFIMHQDSPHLDGKYAAFGMVVSGIEVVDEIASGATNKNDRPLTDVVIEKVLVNRNGYSFEQVEKK